VSATKFLLEQVTPTGKLAGSSPAEDPCPRCGGRHECLTRKCVPVLFLGGFPDRYTPTDPPEGMTVVLDVDMSSSSPFVVRR
jgi:hypothetical protein